jgi:hypothetical protein
LSRRSSSSCRTNRTGLSAWLDRTVGHGPVSGSLVHAQRVRQARSSQGLLVAPDASKATASGGGQAPSCGDKVFRPWPGNTVP